MDRLAPLWRDQPMLLAGLVIALVAAVVGAILGTVMARAGQSLRPLVFVYVFLAILLAQPLVRGAGTVLGLMPVSARAGTTAAARATIAPDAFDVDGGRFRDPRRIFGDAYDPALERDARGVFGDALAGASVARIAFDADGATTLAARFARPADALRALDAYVRFFGISAPRAVEGDPLTVARPQGDRARLVASGPALLVWTATTDAALDRRVAATPAVTMTASREAGIGGAMGASPAATRTFALALLAQTALAVLWFFKGSAWAAGVAPTPGAEPRPASELRARLLALGGAEEPIAITAGAEPGTIEATWRYADARWFDLMRAQRMRRVHRLVLRLDEPSRAVRVREYESAIDWSAGVGGADLSWQASTGITFFEYRRERVLGLQLDANGRPMPRATYAYTFDLQSMKAPLIAAVRDAGWSWRPLVWDAPAWIRWATE